MTITRAIANIRPAAVRVPLWSLWFPLVTLPRFVLSTLAAGRGLRLLEAECWSMLFAFYLVGIDGWV